MSELPNGWQVKTLGQVAVWGSGGTPQAGNPAYYGGSIPWAIIGDLNDGVVSTTEKSITEDGLANSSAKLVPTGAILIAMYGSIGKMGIAGVPMATNQAIAFALPNQDLILPSYLFWFLSSQRELFLSQGKGATQQNISQTLLKAWQIPVPPLDEQRRIIETLEDHLSRLDKALADLDHADSQAVELRRSVLNHLLTNNAAETPTGHAHPSLASWESKSLEEVCSLITDGSHFSPKTSSSGDFPYITVRDIRGNTIDFSNCQYVSEAAFGELQKTGCQPNVGDVLFSKDGTVGKVAIVVDDRPFVVLSSLAILRPKLDLVSPVFLAYVLQSPSVLESALGMKTGTAIRRVVLRNLKKLAFPLPPLSDQLRIVEVLDESLSRLDSTRNSISRQKTSIATLRRSLLNQAFNGGLGTK